MPSSPSLSARKSLPGAAFGSSGCLNDQVFHCCIGPASKWVTFVPMAGLPVTWGMVLSSRVGGWNKLLTALKLQLASNKFESSCICFQIASDKARLPDMTDDHRSSCPIACTLDLVGDRWTLLVLRDMFLGKTRYDEFLASPEKISTNILAERLKRLEALDMITKQPYGSHRRRMEYRLTERGRSLAPVLEAMVDWGRQNVPGTERFQAKSP